MYNIYVYIGIIYLYICEVDNIYIDMYTYIYILCIICIYVYYVHLCTIYIRVICWLKFQGITSHASYYNALHQLHK